VDEAHHTVFFMRFFDEVLGISGGLHGALESVRPEAVAGFRKIFDHELIEAVDAVRTNPSDYAAWVRGITTYHLVVEGMLALTGQKFVLRTIRQFGILPGFYAGFTAVTRDESRHVNYGVGAMAEAVVQGLASGIETQITELLEPACWTILAPDREIPYEDPEAIPEDIAVSPLDIIDFSLQSLTKRLGVIGLSKDFCREVEERGRAHYAKAVETYESTFSKQHPIRRFEELRAG
jgi:ribonucleoside-diphosphate reductase beta chain